MKVLRKKRFALYFCLAACICLLVNFLTPWHVNAFTSRQIYRSTPLYKNLGDRHHPITTRSPRAQRYFDQGLTWLYGFNHAQAVLSFEQGTKLDPNCAMCYWGIALALGPNINAPMSEDVVPQAYQAAQKALQLAPQVSKREQSYIRALSLRYSDKPTQDRQSLDLAYANAMREVVRSYPEDLDAATLFAESLMDLMPWNYYTEDGKSKPETNEVTATLESVLERDPNHPGAIHYYIHAVEASSTPERAEAAAERLGKVVPGSGHLVHMPSHLYLRVGRYHDASVANQQAIEADRVYLSQSQTQGIYRSLYYPHNIHFLWQTSLIEGRSKLALATARKLVAKVSPEQIRQVPFTEIFLPTPFFTFVQFGKWDEMLTEPQPLKELEYTQAMWHYGRGMALIAKGRVREAVEEHKKLQSFGNTEAIATLEGSGVPAKHIIEIAQRILVAKIAGLRGDSEETIAQLKIASKIEDELPYMEPPYWYSPVRQYLGTELLKLDRSKEAEEVYREDLQLHPHSGWSLFGLGRSLQMQGKVKEAVKMQQEFKQAWVKADVILANSKL